MKEFEYPVCETVRLDATDVICTSGLEQGEGPCNFG